MGIGGRVLVLQPRRMAARAAARRIAAEQGTSLGEGVGYQVRFDQQIGPRTRIALVTEGILLRMLHDDPLIESVGAVVFDEFHERNLNSDLALGMVRRIQQTVRPELKIVVMSATLDAAPVAGFLGNCPVITSEGRLFPVEIRYAGGFEKRPLGALVASGVEQVAERTEGDILVFLPGVGEIRQAAAELQAFAGRRGFTLFELYGDLPPEQQDAVLADSDRRKIVLSTNVAETSLTIPGITAVVDTGLARQLRFDPSVGLDRLALVPISKASADQRAGRAGRTAAGVCLRLWEERTHAHRPAFEQPEIHRVDLAAPVLQLWSWGETDVLAFPWFELPSQPAVETALAVLDRLGAIEGGTITEIGRVMARLPVHPRIGRLLIEGHRRGCARRTALAAALLSERDPFLRSGGSARGNDRGPRTAVNYVSRSDVLDRVAALEEFESAGRAESSFGPINRSAAAFVLRARDQLLAEIRREMGRPNCQRDAATRRLPAIAAGCVSRPSGQTAGFEQRKGSDGGGTRRAPGPAMCRDQCGAVSVHRRRRRPDRGDRSASIGRRARLAAARAASDGGGSLFSSHAEGCRRPPQDVLGRSCDRRGQRSGDAGRKRSGRAGGGRLAGMGPRLSRRRSGPPQFSHPRPLPGRLDAGAETSRVRRWTAPSDVGRTFDDMPLV